MDSREQRIATLAATLKSSGVAKSESQAKMMAEEMIGVEDKVQKNYEERHAAAHEHIQTSKHLGNARITQAPVSKVDVKKPNPVGTFHSEPVVPTRQTSSSSSRGSMNSDYPNVQGISLSGSSGSKSSSNTTDAHNTHNSLIESIKAQVSQQEIPSLYDQYMEKTKDTAKPHIQSGSSNDYVDYLHAKPIIDDQRINPIGSNAKKNLAMEQHDLDSDKYLDLDNSNSNNLASQEFVEHKVLREESVPGKLVQELKLEVYHDDLPEANNNEGINNEDINLKENISSNNSVAVNSSSQVSDSEIVAPEAPKLEAPQTSDLQTPEVSSSRNQEATGQQVIKPVLDAQKLVELMEEDGKLEEHTREIKTKPENVKPRESYVENTIDLSDMFKFKR
jgi:hypothetical protein